MSTLKEFAERVADCINDKMKNCDVKAAVQIMKKNNGVERIGVVIKQNDSNVAAVIDIAEFKTEYERGKLLDEIADKVFSLAMQNRQENMDILQITDYEKVKSRLALKLVNRSMNEEMLKDMPHIYVFDDLACICYIALTDPENGKIMVHNGLMAAWNVSAADLMQTAMENTEKLYPAKVENLETVLKNKVYPWLDSDGFPSIYIVTHEGMTYGAVAALYKGLLDRLAEQWESDLILIPSSVHEFLVMKKDDCDMEDYELNQMVNEVNSTQLSQDEILSDHVYMYCKETMDVYGFAA